MNMPATFSVMGVFPKIFVPQLLTREALPAVSVTGVLRRSQDIPRTAVSSSVSVL